ncbi:MAG: hypothetical protein AAF420_14840, partial [Pseudomonadota bacterium]
ALSQNAAACELPPNLVSPLETGPFIVSTYHITGVPGSDRVIQVQWPSGIESPLSGVPPGREDGATRTLVFNVPNGEVSIPIGNGGMSQAAFPNFTVLVGNGVDLYPLYSSLGSVGGMPSTGGRPLLKSAFGNTYHSSEGFETFPDEDHGVWTRYAYPGPNRVSNRHDTFFRGTPDVGGVEAILRCRRWEDGPAEYSQCHLHKKLEPIFYRVTFDGRNFTDLPVIEFIADRLMECVIGEL